MRNMTVPIYAITLILSAFLLFSVQLLFSKMLLPLLGGSPSVWNTAMVFFQALLLAGYAYAHVTSRHLGIRTQSILHLAILTLAAISLPFVLPAGAHLPSDAHPALWQLGMMVITVGAPFFVVSASAPMLQRWFAGTDHPDAANPYFLYAASNIGSMAALLSYPVIVEPLMTLHGQSAVWALGYGILLILTAFCALLVWKSPGQTTGHLIKSKPADPATVPRFKTKLAWIALAFVPSSLMLGLTTYITTDIASAPLLWILPLALYLSTFIIVFARREIISMDYAVTFFTAFFSIMMFLMSSLLFTGQPIFFLVPSTIFFFACLLCHKKLADMRPSADYLTSFYMYMSLGGVLGGLFNAFIAPVLFLVPLEYTAALCAVVIIRCVIVAEGKIAFTAKNIMADLKSKLSLMIILSAILLAVSFSKDTVILHFAAGIFVVLTMTALRMKPFSYAIFSCALLLVLSPARQLFDPDILKIERNFFGIIRVTDGEYTRNFFHGTTLHGAQPHKAEHKLNPITYYNPHGGFGDSFDLLAGNEQKIGIIGLGSGSLSCFTRPGRSFDYYEIDPAVAKIAADPQYFTYLSGCGSPYEIIIGDGRMKMAEAPDKTYDLIVVDAFSSDNIPVHILTADALEIYGPKLKPDGALLYHISNRHLNLEPVLKAIADKAGYLSLIKITPARQTAFESKLYYTSSMLVILTKNQAQSDALKKKGWSDLVAPANYRAWTDDYANIAAALYIFNRTPGRFPEKLNPEDEKKGF